MENSERSLSTMRLYGSAVALVSGAYSVYLATTATAMSATAWGMLVLGIVVIVHGFVLLTPATQSIGGWSGPLMILYALLMLANQAWMEYGGMSGEPGMNGGMGGGMNGGMGEPAMQGMGTDAGMVAIAVLMLISGLIMSVRREMMP